MFEVVGESAAEERTPLPHSIWNISGQFGEKRADLSQKTTAGLDDDDDDVDARSCRGPEHVSHHLHLSN